MHSIPRRANVSWRHCHFQDLKTHCFPLEHSWPHFLFVRKVFKSAFWSKMERKERKLALTIVASGLTQQTPFCKHALPLCPTLFHTYTNIRQWQNFVDKTKPSMGDWGKCVNSRLMAYLMHKLIVYGNGVTNPTITIPHGMMYIPWGKNEEPFLRIISFCLVDILSWLLFKKKSRATRPTTDFFKIC